ncbi:hypothetical protein AVEN_213207-1 [Araneus ventricosus]|uniref:Uncharacterized protein n=2 Tax=Araneus ventricosus TaxID=182803 RepID=A0A4Y2NVC3_ARAVE|nr:hypothetical protein AVEN_43965-1 [Araneus ventricosus]GBN42329.1 hypothetical protein AVEN_213207-1 [Araneus ventricosus]
MNAVSIPGSEELEVLSPSCIEIVQLVRRLHYGRDSELCFRDEDRFPQRSPERICEKSEGQLPQDIPHYHDPLL